MQILTPSGYREIADCQVGDEVVAFDAETGAPIVNVIETKQWVDATEWARWWQVEPEEPPFTFYRINGRFTINSEQSIWRNGTKVCHGKHLVVGDTLYDDADRPFPITSIDELEAAGWWRFDISGDHSYIVDGLTLHNASRFWVLGTASWTAVNTANWASASNGAGGQTVPGSADAVTFDGSSGGGTVTVNFGGTITITSLTCGAFTGTLDFSANNNSVTLSAAFTLTGSATRTINLGSGTWTFSGTGTIYSSAVVTGMTFSGGSAVLVFTAVSGNNRAFNAGAGLTYGTVTINANSSGGSFNIVPATGTTTTFTNLNISAPNYVTVTLSQTLTVTNAPTWSGSSGSQIGIASTSAGTPTNIVSGNNSALSWCGIRDVAFAGAGTHAATNSFNLGNNSGITITGPSSAGMLYVPALEGV